MRSHRQSAAGASLRERNLGHRAGQGIRGRQAAAVAGLEPGRTPRACGDHARGCARGAERGPGACRPHCRHGRSRRDRACLRYGARIVTEGARDGHTGAVTAAARLLVREGHAAMMTMPGDIPRTTSAEIAATVAAHRAAPAFTIVPAHDDLGSNTILMSPPDAVPLRFGEDSFYPHLDAARARGIDPLVVRHQGNRDGHRQSRRSRQVSQDVAARGDPDARVP